MPVSINQTYVKYMEYQGKAPSKDKHRKRNSITIMEYEHEH